MSARPRNYLPPERPPLFKLLIHALHHVLAMLPTTVIVALLTGFPVETALFASGVATLIYCLATGRQLPFFYGANFSYLPAIIALTACASFSGYSPVERIAFAQFGIIVSGLALLGIGLLVSRQGHGFLTKLLPPVVTGPFTMLIGLSLAANAIHECSYVPETASLSNAGNFAWLISIATLAVIIALATFGKGIWRRLALPLGAGFGCLIAFVIYRASGLSFFQAAPVAADAILAAPGFTLPKVSWLAVAALLPIGIASIPESAANQDQLNARLTEGAYSKGNSPGGKRRGMLGRQLIGEGVANLFSGFLGGPAVTSSEENLAAMEETGVFSSSVLIAAAAIVALAAFFTPLIRLLYAVPYAVIGGVEIYHLGALVALGAAILGKGAVDLTCSKNVAVIALILIVGVGGQFYYSGNIPFFGLEVPSIAGALCLGVAANLLLSGLDRKK